MTVLITAADWHSASRPGSFPDSRHVVAACAARMADNLEQSTRENARRPAKTSGDSVDGKQHSLADQIEAVRHLASKRTSQSKRLGLGFAKIVTPGAD